LIVRASRFTQIAANFAVSGTLLALVFLVATRGFAENPPNEESDVASVPAQSIPPGADPACCKPLPPPVAAWDVLRDEIRSKKKTHRLDVIAALAVVGTRPDVLQLLYGALQDKHAEIRKTAAIALGEMQAEAAKPKLRALLDDESPEVGFAAANALWKMGDHSGREIFISTLTGERKGEGFIKSSVKSNFAKYSDPKAIAMTGVKEAAGAFLGPLPMGITIAQELMKDHGASARAACAALLAKDPSPDAVEELTQALKDKNWAVRAAAAQALAVSPGKVSADVFKPLLFDDNKTVREIAAAGIIRLTRSVRPSSLRWPTVPPPMTAEAKQP
jgi:hypothetical protein